MIVGYDFFGDGENAFFDTRNPVGGALSMLVGGAVYDELHLSNGADAIVTGQREDWGPGTVLLARFAGDLEAGTITAQGLSIESLRIKRRKFGELAWQTLATLPYDGDGAAHVFRDGTVASDTVYEWAVFPVVGSGEGPLIDLQRLEVRYDACFISDADTSYRMYYNFELGSVETVVPNSVHEPLSGSRYPLVSYSAQLRFMRGSLQATLFVDPARGVDMNSARRLRDGLMDFLCNRRPKLIRSADGLFVLAAIVGTPVLSPFNRVRGVFDLSFEFVEIGDAQSIPALRAAGIVADPRPGDTGHDGSGEWIGAYVGETPRYSGGWMYDPA